MDKDALQSKNSHQSKEIKISAHSKQSQTDEDYEDEDEDEGDYGSMDRFQQSVLNKRILNEDLSDSIGPLENYGSFELKKKRVLKQKSENVVIGPRKLKISQDRLMKYKIDEVNSDSPEIKRESDT